MALCAHPELLKGNVHTGFIEQHKNVLLSKNLPNPELISQVNVILYFNYNLINCIIHYEKLILFYCFRQLLL